MISVSSRLDLRTQEAVKELEAPMNADETDNELLGTRATYSVFNRRIRTIQNPL